MINRAGGVTPWGTWLSCEENFTTISRATRTSIYSEAAALKRYGVPGAERLGHHDRFDLAKEPNEVNRFGWVVEIDLTDPASTPVKRTAMGRFKHEGAAGILSADGRYVVFQGDDERFDYVYRFVTEGRVNLQDRAANRDLLDSGTLSVARFGADGRGEWLPLVYGRAR